MSTATHLIARVNEALKRNTAPGQKPQGRGEVGNIEVLTYVL
jgi:hypothetical protein